MRVFVFSIILLSYLFSVETTFEEIRQQYQEQLDAYEDAKEEFNTAYEDAKSDIIDSAQGELTEEQLQQIETLGEMKESYENGEMFDNFLEEYKTTEEEIEAIETASGDGGLDDAKGEIDNINELMKEKHDHKIDFVIPNTKKLLKLELHHFLTLKKTLRFKKNLTKINTFYKNGVAAEE